MRKTKTGSLAAAVEALTGKLNLTALGLGAVGAAAFQSWAVLGLGAVAYSALSAWDFVSKREPKNHAPDTPNKLPATEDIADAEVRALVARIRAARGSINTTLEEAPPEVSAQISYSLVGLEELEGRAAHLVVLAEALTQHLQRVSRPMLSREAEELEGKAARAKDDESRELYRQAANARREELRALDEVGTARERLIANLERILSHLEAVPTRVVRMRVLDAASAHGSSDEIGGEIERMNGELAALEQTLEVLVGEKSP